MANSFISDGTTHSGTFAAVVYSAFAGSSRLQMALSPQTTAAVIDAIVGSRPKALGLDLASLALVRADEVIEVVVSSPTHPRCCDAGRPIGDARVPRAIGQSFD